MNDVTVPSGSTLDVSAGEYDQVDISPGSTVNVNYTYVQGMALYNAVPYTITTAFNFEDGSGTLNLPGPIQGAINGFQSGDVITIPSPYSPMLNPSYTKVVYDSSREALAISVTYAYGPAGSLSYIALAEAVVGQYNPANESLSSRVSITTPASLPATSVPVNATRAQAIVIARPGMEQVSAPGLNTETLLLGQSIQFLDGTLSFDRSTFEPSGSNLPQLLELYELSLGRAPDTAGENLWNAFLNSGTTLSNVATGFLQSPEYQAKFGSLANADFVTDLYRNGLGRAPDAAGLSEWTGLLANGVSRGDVLVGFVQAAEVVQHNQNVAASGVFTPNP